MTEPKVILQGIVGSTAYGLATPDSDEDRLGVFVAPTEAVLGLRGPDEQKRSIVTHDPDVALHEVGKFCRLALNCNPTVMDLLWLPAYDVQTVDGQALVWLRKAVLSTDRVRKAYGGYAVQQARKMAKRADEGKEGFSSDLAKRTAKHARHCMRLMLQGSVLLRTGELQLDMSDVREYLFDAGDLAVESPERFAAMFERELAKLDEVGSILPDEPYVHRVERTLVCIRRHHL